MMNHGKAVPGKANNGFSKLGTQEVKQRHVSAHRIFVSRLSPKTTNDSLRHYFVRFGAITECALKTRSRPRNGIYEQFAFIRYPNEQHAKDCLQAKHVVDGWRVNVQEAIDECGNVDLENTSVIPQKMFVGGLPSTCDQSALLNAFSKYGVIVDCMVSFDQKTNRSRLFGFVEFRDPESVVNALKDYHVHRVEGKWVETKRCIARDQIPNCTSPSTPRSKQHQEVVDLDAEWDSRERRTTTSTGTTDDPLKSREYDRRTTGTPDYLERKDFYEDTEPMYVQDSLFTERRSTDTRSTVDSYNSYDTPKRTRNCPMAASIAIQNMIPFLMGTNIDENSFRPTLQKMLNARCDYLERTYGSLCGVKAQELALALEYAASRNMVDIVSLLIRAGADVNSRSSEGGLTPLLLAAARGYKDVVEILLKAGGKVNMPETEKDRRVLSQLSDRSLRPRCAEDIVMECLAQSWGHRHHC